MSTDTSFTSRSGQDARLQGTQLFNAAVGVTHHYFDFQFNCNFEGIEFYAWDSSKGDTLSMQTQYYAGPTYGWIRYKKFGKTFNVFPNNVTRIILFPTEPILGVRIKFTYDNKGSAPVDFSANLFQFKDHEVVNTAILDEGADW